MIVQITFGITGCIPEGTNFITSQVCDQSIVITIVRYLWCAAAKSATLLAVEI